MTELEELPFPKPRKRLVDPKAIKAYVRAHPRCELRGCPSRPCPEPHHLVSRKMGGDDVPENLLRLCLAAHMEFHHCGGREWYRRHQHELTDEARDKVRTALRIEDPPC